MKVVKVEIEVNNEMSEADVQQIVEDKIKATASHKFKKKMAIFSMAIITLSIIYSAFAEFKDANIAYMLLGGLIIIVVSFMGFDTTELIKMRAKK